MTRQPKYHWQFAEKEGGITRDTISGTEGIFLQGDTYQSCFGGHGRIGNAVRLKGKTASINFGNKAGRFGTSDFTVAFGLRIESTYDHNDLDLIGNRKVHGHGNWFSLRLEDQERLTFAVDENSEGKNCAMVKTRHLPGLTDARWHHIAIVRAGRTLKIYFDGALATEGASKTGIANINSSIDVRLGYSHRVTPAAQYEDLRIYHDALNATEIQSLITPVTQPFTVFTSETSLFCSND
ncbi:MAG: LamG domain-containing protein [Cyanobacteria bacterium J06598_1]